MTDQLEELTTGRARYLSCAETAKLIRAELKLAFPGVKFSVRSRTYAGGASIDVAWVDGPTGNSVDAVAGRFAGATFDGMIDLKSYHESRYKGERLHFGADFVFSHRKVSDEWRREIITEFSRVIGRDLGDPTSPDFTWWQQVPLMVERFGDNVGRLLHMVETDTQDLGDVFHQYVGFRSRKDAAATLEP